MRNMTTCAHRSTVITVMVFVMIASRSWNCSAIHSIPPAITMNAIELQHNISAAAAASNNTIAPAYPHLVVPAGNYVFSNQSLTIQGAQNMVIEAEGNGTAVTFTFFYGFGVMLSGCKNLTVKGITLDSDPPNYAQLVLQTVQNSTTLIAKADAAFLPPDTSVSPFNNPGGLYGAKVMFWDPTTRQTLGNQALNFLSGSAPAGDGGVWKLDLHEPLKPNLNLTTNSTLITVFGRRGSTWQCFNCSEVLVEDVTIHAGGNMGFHENLGKGGNVYRRVKIGRNPTSNGLMALNADGFHSSDMEVGPTLEDSEISFTGDDFVNIHNRMLVICDVDPEASNTSLIIIDVSGGGLATAALGDELRFYQLLPGQVNHANPFIGTGVVRSVSEVTDPATISKCHNAAHAMQQPPYNAQMVVGFGSSPIFTVHFSTSLPVPVTATRFNLVNFDKRSGARAVIRNTHFHDNCGSGGSVLVKAFNSTIENNIMARFSGLTVTQEQNWLEGDLGVRNVYLNNNTIIDVRNNGAPRINVMSGLVNITCVNTTFVLNGTVTHKATGCA
eukprot:m.265273 g.265273  ORF g.265273 m.265273 type:complete len:555 (+) comp60984_c0_seq1:250-1914(+)